MFLSPFCLSLCTLPRYSITERDASAHAGDGGRGGEQQWDSSSFSSQSCAVGSPSHFEGDRFPLVASRDFSAVDVSQFLSRWRLAISRFSASSSPVMIIVAVTLQCVLSCDSQQDCELPSRRCGLDHDLLTRSWKTNRASNGGNFGRRVK